MHVERVDTSTTGLMPIGRFSRATRLSLKALRLYDALGLLPPAQVDEDSGYRYYRQSQVASARLIAMLRQLDMPLNDIAEVLTLSGADAVRAVETYWRGVESETQVKRRLLARIEKYLLGEAEIMHEVATRNVDEQKVISIERRTLADALPDLIRESGERLIEHAQRSGQVQNGPMMVIYHGQVTMDADGPVEVCVPVSGAVEPVDDIRVRIEPAHSEAYARITKAQVAYPEILNAYDSVHAWLEQNGKDGGMWSPREVYFADWMALGDDEPACDVAWPFDG